MAQLLDLVEKRAEHEALKETIMSQARSVAACACWHDDAHGVEHLKARLIHMFRLAERLEATLDDIRAIEDDVFAR